MEDFTTRIHILHEKGATIAYVYRGDFGQRLELEYDASTNNHWLSPGSQIVVDGEAYTISRINFGIENELYQVAEGERYNCQLNVFVE